MQIVTSYEDVPVEDRQMRTFVAAPHGDGQYPAIAFYTDIFQLTPSSLRWASRLASYGYVVAVPEIYNRVEPAGWVGEFDDEGKARGQADVEKITAAQFDVDIAAIVDWLPQHSRVSPGPLGIAGHCTGGHIGFRAAFQPSVAATALWYPTGLDNGKLGADADTKTITRAGDIHGELLMIWGKEDPHTGAEGRAFVKAELDKAEVNFAWHVFEAEHAFARDIGPRWDPEVTDESFALTIELFRRTLGR